MSPAIPTLSARQRVDLRRRGQRLRPTLHVGRSGLSDAFVSQVRRALEREDLIKIRVPADDGAAADQHGDELARRVPCCVVARTGFVLLLHAPAATDEADGAEEGIA